MKSKAVNLYVGLPIAALQGAEATVNQKAVQDFLSGSHTWHADGVDQQLEVADVVVASQPVASIFDFLLTDTG